MKTIHSYSVGAAIGFIVSMSSSTSYADWIVTDLGGNFESSFTPAADFRTDGFVDIFAVNKATHSVWWRAETIFGWTAWQDLGGVVISSLSAVANSSSHTEVFGLGTDFSLWHQGVSGSTPQGWEWLSAPPGGICSPPVAVTWGLGSIFIFVTTCGTGHLAQMTFDGTSWSGWSVFTDGPSVQRTPAVVSYAQGRLDVFVLASPSDGSQIWNHSFNGSYWSWANSGIDEDSHGGSPTAAVSGTNRVGVFSRFDNARLAGNEWTGAFGTSSLSDYAFGPFSPHAITVNGIVEIYYKGLWDNIAYTRYANGTWLDGTENQANGDGVFASEPVPVEVNGTPSVFAVKKDGSLLSQWRSP